MDHPVLTSMFNRDLLVHIVEPNLTDCESLSLLFRLEGFRTTFSTSLPEALAQFNRQLPEIVVANSLIGNEPALVLLRNLKTFKRGVPMFVLQDRQSVDDAVELMRAGASYVVTKPLDAERLLRAVRDELRRSLAFQSSVRGPGQRVEVRGFPSLTNREAEVLTLLSNGASNREAGKRLNISHRTVEVHRARVMEKLGARNTADLMRIVFTS